MSIILLSPLKVALSIRISILVRRVARSRLKRILSELLLWPFGRLDQVWFGLRLKKGIRSETIQMRCWKIAWGASLADGLVTLCCFTFERINSVLKYASYLKRVDHLRWFLSCAHWWQLAWLMLTKVFRQSLRWLKIMTSIRSPILCGHG